MGAIALSSCKKDQVEPQINNVVEDQSMNVTINHKVNGSELIFLTNEFTLAAGTEVKPSRLSYLLSNFYLVKEGGEKLNLDDQYALIDARNGEIEFKLKGIPKGKYEAIGFSLGLDSATNHGDPNQYPIEHPLSSVNNALHWNWTSGYIFIAIEGKLATTSESYVYHIAGANNRVDYNLPFAFEKKDAVLDASLEFNYAEIFTNPSTFNMQVDGMTTHSTTDQVTLTLVDNMSDIFTVKTIK